MHKCQCGLPAMAGQSVCEFCYDSREGYNRLTGLLGGQGRAAREVDSSASWLGWLFVVAVAGLIAAKVFA